MMANLQFCDKLIAKQMALWVATYAIAITIPNWCHIEALVWSNCH